MSYSSSLKALYTQYAGSLAYIATTDAQGATHIGSAFHVGSGVFVTARHVVEHQIIVEVATTSRAEIVVPIPSTEHGQSTTEVHFVAPRVLQIARGPFYHKDPTMDVAVFQVAGLDQRTPRIPLDSQRDADLRDDSFILAEALVLGYPPVPTTDRPLLVVVGAQVNAVIDPRDTRAAHFVISATARGGFSGGLVLAESEHALGLVTKSLVKDDNPAELGFMTVLCTEPIQACIDEHFEIDGLTQYTQYVEDSTINYRLVRTATQRLNPRLSQARVSVFDDDRDVFVEFSFPDSGSLARAFSAFHATTPLSIVEGLSRPGYLFALPDDNPPAQKLARAVRAAIEAVRQDGYEPEPRLDQPAAPDERSTTEPGERRRS